MKKIIPILLALLLITGCAQTSSAPPSGESTCQITIIGLDDELIAEKVYLTEQVAIEEGESVLDITERATNAAKMTLEVTGAAETAYVVAINQLYPGDNGKQSGWMFYVNDELPDVGCAVFEVAADDQIKWVFVPDFDQLEW